MTTNSDVLTTFLGYDEKDLEFEKIASDLDSHDIEHGVEVIFDYYRRNGFPHYTVREDEKHQHMRKIQRFDVDTIFKDNQIIQTMHGLRMAWTYFPHWVDIRCGNAQRTPMETFMDDEKLKSVIRKCWRWCSTQFAGEEGIDKNKFRENRFRQSLKIYTGTQAVSNFRPTAAKLIYEKFGGDTIWDMSCGWGGRLIGFLASSRKKYIGSNMLVKMN